MRVLKLCTALQVYTIHVAVSDPRYPVKAFTPQGHLLSRRDGQKAVGSSVILPLNISFLLTLRDFVFHLGWQMGANAETDI